MSGGRAPHSRRLLLLGLVAIIPLVLYLVAAPAVPGTSLPRYCTVNVTVQGTFQSNIANYVTGLTMTATEGACYGFPLPNAPAALNIFPYTFKGTLTMSNVAISVPISIPALQISYPFTQTIQFNGISPGTYMITWSSPLSMNGPFTNTYTQSTTFKVT